MSETSGSDLRRGNPVWIGRIGLRAGESDWALQAALVLCAGVFAWVGWQKLWSFWLDESMLLTAIDHVSTAAGLFRPLPLYDQGAPTGFVLLAWAVERAALPMFTQKLLPIAAGAAVLPVLMATVRRSGFGLTATIVSLFLLIGSDDFAYQFGNFKQYAFEMLAVAVVLLAAVSPRREASVLLLATCALSLLLTFVTPFILVMLPFLYRRVSTRLLAGAIAVLALCFGAAYVTYLATALQFTTGNYLYVFEKGLLPPSHVFSALLHVLMAHTPELPVQGYRFQRLFTLVTLLSTAAALVRRERVALMFAALSVTLCVLSVAGVYPLIEGRYTGYLVPPLAWLAGRGVQAVATALRPARALVPTRISRVAHQVQQAILLVLIAFSLLMFVRNERWFTEVGGLPFAALAAADAAGPDAIVPLGLLQPQIDLLRSRMHLGTLQFIEVNAASASTLPDAAITANAPDLFREPGAWPLLMRAEQVHLKMLKVTSPLDIDQYYGWVVRQMALRHRSALILPVCLAPPDAKVAGLLQQLEAAGTLRVLQATGCFRTFLWTRANAALVPGPAPAPP